MPCYTPGKSKSGQTVSCGGCKFCRLKYAGEWAVRMTHEASLYTENSFITLTYDDKRLPEGYDLRRGLDYTHIQNFLKDLRDSCGGITKVKHHNFGKINSKTNEPYPQYHRPIRFYVAGEYGDLRARPHWHACLFNFDFSDRYFWRWRRFPNGTKYPVYRSPTLEKLWPHGNSEIGSVTFQSAGYCARYIMKKQTSEKKDHLYTTDGVLRPREFCRMSTRPGIAAGWFSKFNTDVFPLDRVVLKNGKEVKPPRYYDKLYFKMTQENLPISPFYDSLTGEIFTKDLSPLLDNIKYDRMAVAKIKLDDPNAPSLDSIRIHTELKVSKLKRSLTQESL